MFPEAANCPRPDWSRALQIQTNARCGHFIRVWTNDPDPEIAAQALAAGEADDCINCRVGRVPALQPFPVVLRFTRFL